MHKVPITTPSQDRLHNFDCWLFPATISNALEANNVGIPKKSWAVTTAVLNSFNQYQPPNTKCKVIMYNLHTMTSPIQSENRMLGQAVLGSFVCQACNYKSNQIVKNVVGNFTRPSCNSQHNRIENYQSSM